jgi:hypothetical protein
MGLESIGEIIIAVLIAEVIVELLKAYLKRRFPSPPPIVIETRAVVDEFNINTSVSSEGSDYQTEEGNQEGRGPKP